MWCQGRDHLLGQLLWTVSGAGGGLAFYISDGTSYVLSPAIPPERVWDGAWHYAVGTRERVRLYLDGAQVGAGVAAELQIRYGLASTTPLIGGYLGSCQLPFSGDIDEVRVSNEALDPAWIAAFAASGPGANAPATPPPPLTPDAAASGGVQRTPAPPGPRCLTIAIKTHRMRAHHLTRIRATVRRDGRPAARIRVIAKGAGARAAARTNTKGRVLLELRPRRPGIVRLRLIGRTACNAARLRVAR
jgi:Concanavalin A-like lectin/glucanases superfamily